MKSYKTEGELLDLFAKFQNERDSKSLELFALWLLEHHNSKRNLSETSNEINSYITMLLGFLGRFATYYSRKIFRDTTLHSLDDYGILLALQFNPKLSKAELMRLGIMEKSFGTEVIKRLIDQGFVKEIKNKIDKRERLLTLTDSGKEQIRIFGDSIASLSNHVVGKLSKDERTSLLKMLQHLNQFHYPFFEENNEVEINKILAIKK